MYGLAQDYYAACNPTFGVATDARLTVFAKCANVIASINFGVHFMIENMMNDDWWKRTEPWANQIRKNQNYDSANDLREYEVTLRVSLLILHLRAIESSFRDYARAIWTNESSNGTAEFSRIYGIIVDELKLDLQFKELLDLYNTTRNLVHNNGVFFPRNPNPAFPTILTYIGSTYPFEPKKLIEFTRWDFVLMLVRDSLDMLIAVVNHNIINSVPEIKDSFANQNG